MNRLSIIGFCMLFISIATAYFGASRFSYHDKPMDRSLDELAEFLIRFITLPSGILGIVLLIIGFVRAPR